MPCNIRISKMILLSLQLGIAPTMIDISAILMTQKGFFVHEEKRTDIEEFMHSLVGYDRGDYNDFLLRQRLFSHWRNKFFQGFFQKNYCTKNNKGKSKDDVKENNRKSNDQSEKDSKDKNKDSLI